MSVGTEMRYAADVSPVVVVGFTVNLSLSSSFLLSNAFSVLMVGRESGQGGEEPCISHPFRCLLTHQSDVSDQTFVQKRFVTDMSLQEKFCVLPNSMEPFLCCTGPMPLLPHQ